MKLLSQSSLKSETERTQNMLTTQLPETQGPLASLQNENMREKQEEETKTNKEETEEPESKVEAKVDQDFAIIATKSVITARVHAPNQKGLELQTKREATHHIREEPHLRVKEEKLPKDQTLSE